MLRRCLSAIVGGLFFIELFLPRAVSAAPDNTHGMALLMAVVNQDATLARGAGALSVASLGTGVYEVLFDRDISDCAFVGSLGDANTTAANGTASAVRRSGKANGAFVQTYAPDGTFAPKPFHLIVFCAK